MNALAKREDWQSAAPHKARKRKARGGGWEYHISLLPAEAQAEYRARIAAAEANTAIAQKAEADQAVVAQKATDLKARQRAVMEARATVLREIERRVISDSVSQRKALLSLIDDFNADRDFVAAGLEDQRRLPVALYEACVGANDRRKGLSRSIVYGWIKARDEGGVMALAPKLTRVKQDTPDWLSGYLRHYCVPSKPSMADALEQMERDALPGQFVPNYDQVRRALKALKGTANFLDAHKGREGRLQLKARLGFVTRTMDGLDPAVIYTADGKTFDAMVAHPRHGRPFRPEITTVIDVVTRRVVGWSVDLAENQRTVADALRRACVLHSIPAIFYTDRGPGYANDYLDHDTLGLCARLGITSTHSLPRNSQARGLIERINGNSIWNRCAKRFSTYMGADMDREAAQASHKAIAKDIKEFGESKLLPSWDMFMEAAQQAVDEYNDRPHSALRIVSPATGRKRKASPNEVWDDYVARGFEVVPLEAHEADDLFRPHDRRKVHRGQVTHNTNQYYDAALEPYHGMDVLVGYDLHDAQHVWVRELEEIDGAPVAGRLICVADFWNNKERYMPKTMTEKAIETRAKGRLKRIDAHRQEALEEANPPLTLPGETERPITLDVPVQADPVPAQPATAEIIDLSAAKPAAPRKPRFADDYELAMHCIDHPEDVTVNRRRVLASLFKTPSARQLFEMKGGSLDDLKNLLNDTAHLHPDQQSSSI